MKKTFFLLTGVLFVLLFFGCPDTIETPSETPKSNNANLKSLTLSTGTLSPVFNAATTSYSVTVPYETTSLTITGVKADPKATMDPENGVVTLNDLKVGETKETIKVKAEDGTEKTYTVTVTREAGSSNANLKSLTVSTGSLSPVFSPTTTSYTVTVANSVTSLTVTGTKSHANATMTPSNGKLEFANLSVDTPSEKTIKVTAEDGTTTQEYKVKVVKLPSNDATLSALTTDKGSLSPVFSPTTTSYTVTVPYETTSLTITGVKADPKATMEPENGVVTVDKLEVGVPKPASIKVIAEDGTEKTYTVKIDRDLGPTNAYLQSLEVSDGYSLEPSFTRGTFEYTVTVPNSVTSLTVTGTKADANATMTPSELSFTGLSVGTSSEQTITVTAEDGTTTQKYKVKVTRCEEIKMLPVPAGSFQRDEGEENVSVITKAYSLSKYPITRKQFLDIMGTDPSDETYSSGKDDPVQMVNSYHAIAFCNKLSLLEGLTPAYTVEGVNFDTLTYAQIPTKSNAAWNAATPNWDVDGYRLPTEMEWMWAAMGADQDARADAIDADGINRTGWSKNYAGEGYGTGRSIGDYAWYNENSGGKTHPVGGKLPNELGLYDMSGNVWEWCWDRWKEDYPADKLTDYRGAGSGSYRVYRGGSRYNSAPNCTVAGRGVYFSYDQDFDYGFRILRPVL